MVGNLWRVSAGLWVGDTPLVNIFAKAQDTAPAGRMLRIAEC
jgi:hypothetical protein